VGVAAPGLADLHHERHGIDRARMLYVPNGAYLPRFDASAALRARRALGYHDSDFVIGFIGNLTRWQGLELLLEAMGESRLAQARLWIMGDGSLRATLDAKIAELGLKERIRLLGPKPEEDGAVLAQATQILVAPYKEEAMRLLCGDGVPTMKALFAMACDRPLLAGAIPMIESIGAGEVVTSDPLAWAHALQRWQERWREAGAPLIDWPWHQGTGPGRRYVEAERTWDHTARIWESAFPLIDSRSR
jgi:glycosyltransferase involved in cell wall biosynthesis